MILATLPAIGVIFLMLAAKEFFAFQEKRKSDPAVTLPKNVRVYAVIGVALLAYFFTHMPNFSQP